MGKYNIERISQQIRIGWDGENNWRPQTFDCSSLLATRPSGTVTLWILPNGESEAFPVALTADGNLRTWTPLDSELVGGGGKLQFHCQAGTDVGKSPVYRYVVDDSILTGAEHPDETPSWAVQVVEDVTEAASHYPYIGENGNWFVWDTTEGDFVDTGVSAGGGGTGSGTVTSVNNVQPDANGNVTLEIPEAPIYLTAAEIDDMWGSIDGLPDGDEVSF